MNEPKSEPLNTTDHDFPYSYDEIDDGGEIQKPTETSDAPNSTAEDIFRILEDYSIDAKGKLIVDREKIRNRPVYGKETRTGAGLIIFNHVAYRPNYTSTSGVTTARCIECAGSIYVDSVGNVTLRKECSGHRQLKRKFRKTAEHGALEPKVSRREYNFRVMEASSRSTSVLESWHFSNIEEVRLDASIRCFTQGNHEHSLMYLKADTVNFDTIRLLAEPPELTILLLSVRAHRAEDSRLCAVFVIENESTASFETIFRWLREQLYCDLTRICVDLNENARNAAKSTYPCATIRICYKSVGEAIQKKFDDISDHERFQNPDRTHRILQNWLAFPFVCFSDIDEAFTVLTAETDRHCANSEEFITWMSDNFVGGNARFGREEWSCWARVYENIHVTNGINDADIEKKLLSNRNKLLADDSVAQIAFSSSDDDDGPSNSRTISLLRMPIFRNAVIQKHPSLRHFFDAVAPLLIRIGDRITMK